MLRDAGISVVTDFLAEEVRPELGPYLLGGSGGSAPIGW
jgi:hypothetical protein